MYRLHGVGAGIAVLSVLWLSPGEGSHGSGSASAASAESSLLETQGPSETVLFPFDDHGIPFSKGLLLTLVPGRKSKGDHGSGADPEHPDRPVLSPGQPGDPDHPRLYYYGTVVRVGDEFRMWYTGMDAAGKRLVCYAVSKDGVRWERPKLRLVEYGGSRENNLVLLEGQGPVPGASCWVLYEPDDPDPARRFKMIREVSPSQVLAAFSPDGLRWKDIADNPIIRGSGMEPGGLVRFKGCYYVNGHGGPVPHPVKGASKRMMVTYASYDFEHWTSAAHVSFRRDSVPPRAPSDFELHRGEQVHIGASLWNRGNVLVGFYGQYHNATNDRRTSTCDLGLVVSSDAVHFTEPIPDFKIVPSYEEPDDAEPRLLQGQGFENVGERTLVWYSIWVATNPKSPVGVRLATWPRDRLGYFSPAPRAGDPHFISAPIRAGRAGARIYVNADGLGPESHLRVEVLSEQLAPLPGYSGAESIPIMQSGFRQAAGWRGKQDLAGLDRPLRVRVNWSGARPEDARLYAVYVE